MAIQADSDVTANFQKERGTMVALVIKSNADSRAALNSRSVRTRWICLLVALCWVGVAIGVIFFHHIPEPIGVKGITVNEHTYYGNPPALTLFERDQVSAVFITLAPMLAVLIGFVDLLIRTIRGKPSLGTTAIAAGGLTCLISLFGLLYGLASVGVVGALIILSGLPIHISANNSDSPNR
jgi:hypothetical protein